jgi:hypothetical protein
VHKNFPDFLPKLFVDFLSVFRRILYTLHSTSIFLIHSNAQAHVVSAFEQSLSNMTTRLQQLTRSADEKVSS